MREALAIGTRETGACPLKTPSRNPLVCDSGSWYSSRSSLREIFSAELGEVASKAASFSNAKCLMLTKGLWEKKKQSAKFNKDIW
jgi:hypothetical protein